MGYDGVLLQMERSILQFLIGQANNVVNTMSVMKVKEERDTMYCINRASCRLVV